MTTAYAAVDLGAQSGRVGVGHFDGERLKIDEVHRFRNEPVRIGGRLHWDILRLYADVRDGLRAAARANDVRSVGVDAWGVDFGLIDRGGRLLGNPVHYRDGRRAAAFAGALEKVPPRELFARTGIQLLPINTVFELAAMAIDSDPALVAADRMLLIPDLLHYWLCGSRSTEFTNATTTQCYDAATRGWVVDLLERLDVPARFLPDVVTAGTVLGRLNADVAADTGLGHASVVAPATHDTGSAVAAVPMADERSAFISVGTWSLVGVESTEAVVTAAAYEANLTNEGGVDGTFRILRNVTGLWILEECRRAWARAGREYGYAEIVALGATAPRLAALIDPNDSVFSEPGDMPARISDYCVRTGQSPPADDRAVARCVLESLALKHAQSVDLLEAVTGREIATLHVVGGGANNELLCAWTAAAANRPVLAGPAEATLVGNLLVQAMAAGEIGSLADGRTVVRRSFSPVLHEPVESAAWEEARERFAGLASACEVEVRS